MTRACAKRLARGLALCACLSAAPARTAALEPAELRRSLLESLAAGETDSARASIRADRAAVLDLLESLLADRYGDLVAGRVDSASVRLESAKAIAALHAEEFDDSLSLRSALFHEHRPPAMFAAEAAGWRKLREVERFQDSSDWRSAAAVVPDLLRLARAARDPYLEQRAWLLAAASFGGIADWRSAREAGERSLQLSDRLRDRIRENRARARIAWCDQQVDRLDEAMRALPGILQTARRLGDGPTVISSSKSIAEIHLMRGEIDSALIRYEEVLPLARAAGRRGIEADILVEMGMILSMQGRYEKSMAYEEEGLRIARDLGARGRRQQLRALNSMAWLCGAREQYSRAIVLLLEALSIAEETGMLHAEGIARLQLGTMYWMLGRPEEALRRYEEVLPIARGEGSPRFESEVLCLIGRVERELGRLDEAATTFAAALRAAEAAQSTKNICEALVSLGGLEIVRGRLDAAERSARRLHALAAPEENPLRLGGADLLLAEVTAARGDTNGARARYDQAILQARALGSSQLLRDALAGKARFLRASGRLRPADSLLAEAIASVEGTREGLGGAEQSIGFLENERDLYAARVGVLYALGREEGSEGASHREAFRVAERARARSLLDALAETHSPAADGVDSPLRQRERDLWARLGALQAEVSRAASSEAPRPSLLDSLERERDATVRAHREIEEEIEARGALYREPTGQRLPLGVEEVRERVLLPDQTFLEYLVGDEESFVFLIDRERFRLHRLPVGAESLEALVTRFREAILSEAGLDHRAGGEADSAIAPFERTSRDLYRLLLDPVAPDLEEGARLLITPDGALAYLPFAALHDGRRHLIESHAIAYAPSASALDSELIRGRPPRARSLLAIGNPSSYRTDELLASVREIRGWRLGDLPFAEEEVRRVASHFGKATTLTRGAATEEAVKAEIGGASHVHFATHGLLDAGEPLLSGLALAQDANPSEDGFLQVNEILKLRLSADLIVLSGCNTGLGRLAGGEGVIGLARAFLYAGARGLVMSLWEVGDRSTVELMDRFYRFHFRRKLPADHSLQEAQIELLRRGRPARDWAAFAFTGRAQVPAGEVGESLRRLWPALLAGALLLLAAGIRARLRGRAGRRAISSAGR